MSVNRLCELPSILHSGLYLALSATLLLAPLPGARADCPDPRPPAFHDQAFPLAGGHGFAVKGCFDGGPINPVNARPASVIFAYLCRAPLTPEEKRKLCLLEAEEKQGRWPLRSMEEATRKGELKGLRDKRDRFLKKRYEIQSHLIFDGKPFPIVEFEVTFENDWTVPGSGTFSVNQETVCGRLPRPWIRAHRPASLKARVLNPATREISQLELIFTHQLTSAAVGSFAPCQKQSWNLLFQAAWMGSCTLRPPWFRWLKPGREEEGSWQGEPDGENPSCECRGDESHGGGNGSGGGHGNAGGNGNGAGNGGAGGPPGGGHGNGGNGNGGGHGNNGVGNGTDPQPPGNPPVNDGPGTGPGNPGNRGGTGNGNGGGNGNAGGNGGGNGNGGGHGNNGVGNGTDPQPPGNPPVNDGPGTGPGNPGNRGGTGNGNGNAGAGSSGTGQGGASRGGSGNTSGGSNATSNGHVNGNRNGGGSTSHSAGNRTPAPAPTPTPTPAPRRVPPPRRR